MLGASTYHISAAREQLSQEQEDTERGGGADDELFSDLGEPKRRALQPLGENQHVNMSLD